MPHSVTKEFKFHAAHRIVGHKGKCAHLHGHSYRVLFTVINEIDEGLDPLGMVIDFDVLKRTVGKWIDDNLDHNTILAENDVLAPQPDLVALIGRKPYIISGGRQPTAEVLAETLYHLGADLVGDGYRYEVTVYETDTSFATYR